MILFVRYGVVELKLELELEEWECRASGTLIMCAFALCSFKHLV